MFNVGGGELLVIMLVALIVLGPQRLPGAARQVGKTLGDLRRLSTGFQNEMRSALDEADDPERVAARRNVLAKEAPVSPADSEVPEPVDDAPPPAVPRRKVPLRAADLPAKATVKNGTAKSAARRATAKKAPSKATRPSRG